MSAQPVLRRIVIWGAFLALGIAVVGSIAGLIADGGRGVLSALIGAALAFVFLALTAVSILIATRLTAGDVLNPAFFAIVLGGWILKFVVFLVIVFLLKDQPWVNPVVLFLTIVASVVGSLVIDMVVIARSRMPYVSDVTLPGETRP